MKTVLSKSIRRIAGTALLCLLTLSVGLSTAHARTITLSLEFARQQYSTLDPNFHGQTFYTVFVLVSSDIPPVTSDEVDSAAPNPAFGGSETGYGYSLYNDVGSALNAVTNGFWTLTANKGDVSEKQYTFTVSASGLDATNFPAVQIIMPGDGNAAVSTNATFLWSGPASWDELDLADHSLDFSFYTAESPSPSTTSWNDAPLLLGTNEFEVTYKTNGAAWFAISTPMDNLSNPFTNWVGGSKLDDFVQSGFVTSTNPAVLAVNGHTLVAHYTFDDAGNLGHDSSGNGYDLDYNGQPYGSGVVWDSDAKTGGAAYFDGGSFFSYNSTPSNVLSALASDFSLSFWIKTVDFNGNEGGYAFNGAGIVAADIPGQHNDLIPAALDGGEIGFNTGPDDDTVNSTVDINDNSYHHVVITRQQNTGEKQIYIDGALDNSDSDTTRLLNDPKLLAIGCGIDASQSDPGSANLGQFFYGWLDDIQLYSRVLSADQVAQLYGNPGDTISFPAGPDFNPALNTTNLNWTTTGDTSWFIETANTTDGMAAQSGIVTNNQSSTLSITVTGPGTLTFSWACIADNTAFDYEVYTNGDPVNGYMDDLYYNTSGWYQDGPFNIPAGTHTISWTAFAYGDTDPTEAGFLDQVSYVQNTGIVITLNPFSQTNYPGYSVWLSAKATNNPTAIWQWYKTGYGAISGATSSDFIPTNSGTADVQGGYYAVATDNSGSANTTTALVSFVSAPLPPDWSRAVKSPFHAEFDTNVIKDYYGGCAVDSAGEVYIADQYVGNVIVQSNFITLNTLTAVGINGGAALVKYAVDGTPLWAVGLTNNQPSSYSYADCIALAPGNGVYLASALIGTNWLGANQYANNGGNSILLSRFDANGSNIWSSLIGQTNQVITLYNTLVSDASGNVTIAGVINGTADFGGTSLTAMGYMGFLAQYNANGTLLWTQILPTFPQNLAYGGGRLYVSLSAMISSGVTNVSIGSLSNVTDRAWAVACLAATNGQALWLRGVGEQYGTKTGGVSDDIPLISVSGSDVFLTGTAYGSTAMFGGLSVSLSGGRCQYFARYDTNGSPQVATSYGSTTTMPWASTANNSGVYISGDFDDYSQFGNTLIAATVYAPSYIGPGYFTQPFVAKFDRNGNPLWARNGMGSALANFRGIATASDGVWASGIVLLSDIFHPAQFGTNTVSSDGYIDDFGTGIIFLFTQGGLLTKITESSLAPAPVALLNPQAVGANFQFQFLSEAGFSHNILYRTNLAVGNWQTNSSVSGDGSVKTISLPFSLFSPAKQGFIRVSTQ